MEQDRTTFKIEKLYWRLEEPTIVVNYNYIPVHINRKDYGDLNESVRRIMGRIAASLTDNLWRSVDHGTNKIPQTPH